MKPTFKSYLISFLVFGVIMALFRWAEDNVAGNPFDLGKFAYRVVIYGIGMTLAMYIPNLFLKKKPTDKT